MKKMALFLVGAAIPFGIVAVVVTALWVKDIHDDRQHTVTANSTVPVFAGDGDENGCQGVMFGTLERGHTVRVRRIHYLKDCAAIDVALPDGRKGYVVLGTGRMSISPPLPTLSITIDKSP